MLVATLLVQLLLAGKLGEDNGFKGIRFGEDGVLASAPMEGCRPNVSDARWVCDTTIADHAVEAAYLTKEGLFFGMFLTGKGEDPCRDLLTVLEHAWGKPTIDPGPLEKYVWNDFSNAGPVGAAWAYDSRGNTCNIVIMNINLMEQADQRAREKLKGAVDDL